MALRNRLRLFILIGRGTRKRLVGASIGLILGVTLIILFVAAGLELRATILTDLLGALPITQLKVQPRSMDVGVLKVGRPTAGAEGGITSATLDQLRERPDVVDVFGIAYAHFPVSIRGEVLGENYGADAPIQGVDSRWVSGEVDSDYDFGPVTEGDPIPVLVSRKVLQAYNVGFANANQLPQLSEGAIIGQELTIDLGSSSLGGTRAGRESRSAIIVGFSDRVDALALAIPVEVIQAYSHRFTDLGDDRYDAIVIEARSTGDLAALEAEIADLGLELSPDAYFGRQVGQAVTIVILILSAVGIAVVALSLMNIANTLQLVLRERQYELAVARAMGVGENLLTLLLMAEAALAGFLSGVLALGVSFLVLWAGARLLEGSVAPILGTTITFVIPPWLAIGVLVMAPLASGLAALVPARRAVGSSIASALRR